MKNPAPLRTRSLSALAEGIAPLRRAMASDALEFVAFEGRTWRHAIQRLPQRFDTAGRARSSSEFRVSQPATCEERARATSGSTGTLSRAASSLTFRARLSGICAVSVVMVVNG